MRPMQKMACYNLAVIALTASVILILIQVIPFRAAWSGLGLLGFLGLSPLYLKKKKDEILYDERDKQIGGNAQRAGFFIFWLYFVAACVYIPFAYDFKAVSSFIFIYLCTGGVMILVVVQSVATLVLYRRDSQESGAFLDSFREMADLQKSAWLGLIILLFVLTPFLLVFPIGKQGPVVNHISVTFMITNGALFFFMRKSWKAVEMDKNEETIVHRAQRVGLLGLGIAVAAGGLGLTAAYAAGISVSFSTVCYAGLCAFVAGLLVQPISILVQYAGWGEKKSGDAGQ